VTLEFSDDVSASAYSNHGLNIAGNTASIAVCMYRTVTTTVSEQLILCCMQGWQIRERLETRLRGTDNVLRQFELYAAQQRRIKPSCVTVFQTAKTQEIILYYISKQGNRRLHFARAVHSRYPLTVDRRCGLSSTCRRRT